MAGPVYYGGKRPSIYTPIVYDPYKAGTAGTWARTQKAFQNWTGYPMPGPIKAISPVTYRMNYAAPTQGLKQLGNAAVWYGNRLAQNAALTAGVAKAGFGTAFARGSGAPLPMSLSQANKMPAILPSLSIGPINKMPAIAQFNPPNPAVAMAKDALGNVLAAMTPTKTADQANASLSQANKLPSMTAGTASGPLSGQDLQYMGYGNGGAGLDDAFQGKTSAMGGLSQGGPLKGANSSWKSKNKRNKKNTAPESSAANWVGGMMSSWRF